MFSFSAPLNFGVDAEGNHKNYGGVGIGFMNDKLGYELSTNIKLQACGRLPFSNGSSLGLGLEYDFLQKGLDGGQLKPLAPNDPRIPTNTVTQVKGNYVVGLYYNNPMANSGGNIKDVWAGVSATNLKKQSYSFTSGFPSTSLVYSNTVTHFYAIGGLTLEQFIGNPNLELLPSVMIRRNTVTQVEVSALLRYQKKLWGGLNYRSTADALSIMLGYQVNKPKSMLNGLRIGYSYDITLSRIFKVSSGSHEIQLNYCFDISIPKPPIKRILNPRHLERNPNLD